MKPEDLECADYPLGTFTLQVRRCVFDDSRLDNTVFFEIMVFEDVGVLRNYVDLREDPRLLWFAHVGAFERKLADYELIEYNSVVDRKSPQPTWKLSRYSIIRLHAKLDELVSAQKKSYKKTKKHPIQAI